MPNYIPEREFKPCAEAFSFNTTFEHRAREHRAGADFLNGTGYYRNCLRIYLNEEYGYREWVWTYPGSVEELVEDWKCGRIPIRPQNREAEDGIRGELDEITWRPWSLSVSQIKNALRKGGKRVNNPHLIETGQAITCLKSPWSFHGRAHIHEQDDSELIVSYYTLRGLDDVEVIIVPHLVLDEMAAIR